MMADIKPHDHIIVYLVEPRETGYRFRRSRNGWPLHITLAKWFDVPDLDGLQRQLAAVAADTAAFDAQVGGEAMFGPDGDTAVNVMADQSALRDLHRRLVSAVRSQPGHSFMNELWMGDDYKAHITHHADSRRHQGDMVRVDGFHLVRMADAHDCEVVRHFEFGGNGSA